MCIDETRLSVEALHRQALHPCGEAPAFARAHLLLMAREIHDRGLAAQRQIHAEELARTPARKG